LLDGAAKIYTLIHFKI